MLEKLLNTNEPFYTPYTLVVMVAFLGILYLGLSWTDVFMKDGKKLIKKQPILLSFWELLHLVY